MSIGIRRSIAKKIVDLAVSSKSDSQVYHLTNNLPTWFELKRSKDNNDLELHLPVIKTHNLLENNGAAIIKKIITTDYENDRFIKAVLISNNEKNLSRGNSYENVDNTSLATSNNVIVFKLNTNEFIRDTLYKQNELSIIDNQMVKENIVVEFSSPNIAKPFHVGHLRSTIIGNFIANLHEYLENNVKRLNYLGDWGTQFGYLQIGIDMLNLSDDEMKKNPIQNLYNAYITANKAAKADPNIAEKARIAFTRLENGLSPDDIIRWEKYRNYTIEELRNVYQRLGVKFDEYEWESQYNQKKIQNVLNILERKNLLLDEKDGRKIVEVGDRRVPVIKSDGSTLYLARDIAALLDRFVRFKFDRILYVVDNAQTDHFKALFHVVEKADERLRNRMQHINFGRINGMSTRSGNVIFLKDVLDEARDIMIQKQIQSPTTKVNVVNPDDTVADILGISAVIVNDLKQRRHRDYNFNWDKVLQVNGDTGIKLQYTHCRLCSLMDSVPVISANEPIPELLQESEAIQLVTEIAKFSEILHKTKTNLEACILVNYLFSLSNSISRALKRLNVKNEPCKETQAQRMLMFEISKKVLCDGMKILGLQPLTKM